ncbi:Condensin-2 complex subunit G2 isoform B [Glycine soja]|uniref:Condensin-2 complex subunit G2 isoform B n=1 Tax=Glycine soja TaxID=3848 RepID=A0A445M5B8_GLYSO|nr:Condensin-2 complex subunit G2 isoform B [Glycine soja]
MEKRLRSSLQSSAQEFISLATKQNLKSSKSSLKTLVHSIRLSSPLCSSLPPTLSDSISASLQSFQNLLEPNSAANLGSPRTPPSKRPRRSSRRSEPQPEPADEKHNILARLEILGHIALLCVSHPRKPFSLYDLLPGVQALHDNLIVFESEPSLSSAIEGLCEEWWKENLAGRESLISQSLPFLLSRSLTLKKKVDVHRVCVLREAFALFDFDDESIEDLKLLLVRCVISPLYLKTEDGRRFLAFVFGLSDQLGKEFLAMIRSQIPFGRKSMLEAYGDILFRAWRAAQGDSRTEIENGFLQEMIEAAIHAGSGAFASYIRRVLEAFINQRTTDGVEKMLYRLAEPVIFRSLQVANSNVRQNALHLLLDMFPLEDPDATKEEKDTLLDKQFFLLERLLTDDCPEVRTIAVEGSCRVLHLFWEVIPSPIITKMITKIVDDISHDGCNEVRLSMLNGIIYLLGNPHSHEILKVLLPRLRHLMLDKVLAIRVAAVDLLLHLKDVRDFQFNKVVELDVLLSALASDQPPVAQKITKLLLPSYFPSKVPIEEACNRCVTLVKRAPMAGARFCQFAILEGASKSHLMELVKVFLSLILSPDKLDANQIEGFLVATSYVCDSLACEPCYINALKELLDGEKMKGLLTLASKGQAQSSLFNIVSNVRPDDVAGILEECMGVVTNCSGLPEDVDRQTEIRSAHKLLLSLGGFDDLIEALTAFLHKAAYRCHIKFGVDMPSHSVSFAKRKKSKSSGKFSIKSKIINRKQSFEDDYLVAVGVTWQVRDLLLQEDTRKAILESPSLEMLFVSLKVISEVSIVHCGHHEYIDICPVLAYVAFALQMTVDNVGRSSIHNSDTKRKKTKIDSSTLLSENILELTIEHVLNCLEKLFGAGGIMKNHDGDSCNLQPTNRTNQNQNSRQRPRLSPTDACRPSNRGYAMRLVAAAKTWLPDVLLALGSTSILKHTDCGEEHSTAPEQMKLHFPKWPLILAKTELFKANEAEDNESSRPEKFSAFSKLLEMLIILLKKNPSIMDAVGVIFMVSSLIGLEQKDFGLALGLLRFVGLKLFKPDDRDWGDMMLSCLQEIFPKIERGIAEENDKDELEKLTYAKELIEPLWMYHLYETGRVSLADD